MEPVTKHLRDYLPPVALDLEDLKKILKIGSLLPVTLVFETEDKRFSSVEDLTRNIYRGAIGALDIRSLDYGGYSLYVSVTLSGVHISIYELDLNAQDVFSRLKDFLLSRQIKEPWWYRHGWQISGVSVLIVALLYGLSTNIYFAKPPLDWRIASGVNFAFVIMSTSIFASYYRFRRNRVSVIYVKDHPETQQTWDRWNNYLDVKRMLTNLAPPQLELDSASVKIVTRQRRGYHEEAKKELHRRGEGSDSPEAPYRSGAGI